MKLKDKKLIFIIIGIIIIIVIIFFIFNKNNGVLNTNSSEIERQAILWYHDHDELYDKTTIGALYKNGYIDSNENECLIINIDNDKAKLSNKKDCNYNNTIKEYPTIMLNLVQSETNEVYEIGSWTSSDVKVNVKFKTDVID